MSSIFSPPYKMQVFISRNIFPWHNPLNQPFWYMFFLLIRTWIIHKTKSCKIFLYGLLHTMLVSALQNAGPSPCVDLLNMSYMVYHRCSKWYFCSKWYLWLHLKVYVGSIFDYMSKMLIDIVFLCFRVVMMFSFLLQISVHLLLL